MFLHLGLILILSVNPQVNHSISLPITFKCPATRAENLLPQLSKKTGLNLRAGRKMADEVFIIDVKNVKVKDLMDRMASCASARWSNQNSVYRLERPTKLEETLIKNEREVLSRAIKRAIGTDPIKETKVDEPATANLDAIAQMLSEKGLNSESISQFLSPLTSQRRGNNPSLLPAIMQCLDTDQLATMPSNSRLGFSSMPNSMQQLLPLTTLARNALNGLLKEYNNAQAKGHAPKITSQYNKALLIVSRAEYYDFFHFDLKLLATDGTTEQVDTCKIQLDLPPSESFGVRFPVKISWSPRSQIINARMNRSYSARNPINQSLKKQLLNPEQIDPLATEPSDILFSIAKSESCNLVGCLPDDLEWAVLMGRDLGEKLKDATQYVETCPGITTAKSGNWLIVKPANPAEASAKRMDRRVLGQYLRNYNPDKPMPLTKLIELIGGLDKPRSDTISSYMQTINRILDWPDLATDWYDAEPLRFLKLIGSLHRNALLNGKALSLSELNTKAFNYIDEVVYTRDGQLYLRTPDNRQLDASKLLPGGIPFSGTVQLQYETGSLLVEKDGRDERYFSPDTLAEQCLRFWSKNPFYVGRRYTYTLRFNFTPTVEASYSLQYYDPDRTNLFKLDQLPSPFDQELEQAMERHRRSTD